MSDTIANLTSHCYSVPFINICKSFINICKPSLQPGLCPWPITWTVCLIGLQALLGGMVGRQKYHIIGCGESRKRQCIESIHYMD